jgi:hypothetical protein
MKLGNKRGIMFRSMSALTKTPVEILTVFTGFKGSANRKTGNMVQSYILVADVEPVTAWKDGDDVAVCGNCALRYTGKPACYVNKGHDPYAVWHACKRGSYLEVGVDVTFEEAIAFISGYKVRYGAYGDPSASPHIFGALQSHTGYTHQWKTSDLEEECMASVETVYQKRKANEKGWRTYRIVHDASELEEDEIMCPYPTVQCVDCKLCGGAKIPAKNIATLPVRGDHH